MSIWPESTARSTGKPATTSTEQLLFHRHFDIYRTIEQLEAVDALSALAQETRIEVFRLLVRAGGDGLAAGGIGDALDIPGPTLSFHLKELKQARLIRSERAGRSLIYRADYPAMHELLTFLTDHCCEDSQSVHHDPKR